MARHLPYDESTIAQARKVNLVDYLQRRGEPLIQKGKIYYCLQAHDSLVIHRITSEWHWNSQSIHGYNAVDFLISYYKYSFLDAIAELTGERASKPASFRLPCIPTAPQPPEKEAFVLPPRNRNMRRVYAYLTITRGIDPEIVNAFVHAKMLFEDEHHNAVFVGYDAAGHPAYGFARGTLTEKAYKRDLPNADKRFGFRYIGTGNTLYVFEAAIDMLSYISLHKDNWQDNSYVALGGLSAWAMITVLQQQRQITRLVLCLDNDVPGICTAVNYRQCNQAYTPQILRPAQKDWNNELLYNTKGTVMKKEASYKIGASDTVIVFDCADALFDYLQTPHKGTHSLLLCGENADADIARFCADFERKKGYKIKHLVHQGERS